MFSSMTVDGNTDLSLSMPNIPLTTESTSGSTLAIDGMADTDLSFEANDELKEIFQGDTNSNEFYSLMANTVAEALARITPAHKDIAETVAEIKKEVDDAVNETITMNVVESSVKRTSKQFSECGPEMGPKQWRSLSLG